MTKQLKLFVYFVLAGSLFFAACSKDDDDEPQSNESNEVIATDETFTGFQNWTLVAQEQGPDPALGPAHAGNDTTVTRFIYFEDDATRVNGEYPIGTVIVKETYNPDKSIHELTAMVKRGNDFNPDANDWEWFMLTPEGNIMTDGEGNPVRGANLMNGMCTGCHAQAADLDYAFSKP
jgi:hypothetical protein